MTPAKRWIVTVVAAVLALAGAIFLPGVGPQERVLIALVAAVVVYAGTGRVKRQ